MSKFKWLVDSGHGGVKDGKYLSCPTYDPKDQKTWYKMWVHPDGTTIYEGEFNRQIKNRLFEQLNDNSINYFDIAPGVEDISLNNRTVTADDWYKKDKSCIFLSIHGNAGPKQDHGTGFEVFTSKGQTKK